MEVVSANKTEDAPAGTKLTFLSKNNTCSITQ
jgi:hypothetical protein